MLKQIIPMFPPLPSILAANFVIFLLINNQTTAYLTRIWKTKRNLPRNESCELFTWINPSFSYTREKLPLASWLFRLGLAS